MIARRLDELARAQEKIEKRVEALDMDWSEWFDKFRRLYARIAKRQERDEKNGDGEETPAEDAPGQTIGTAEVSQHGGPRPHRRNY